MGICKIMYHFFLVMFVIIAIILIILIMLQQNNGNSIGGFDTRSLGNMLNSGNFSDNITRLIVILAGLFFLFSLLLGNINSKYNQVYTKIDTKEISQKNE